MSHHFGLSLGQPGRHGRMNENRIYGTGMIRRFLIDDRPIENESFPLHKLPQSLLPAFHELILDDEDFERDEVKWDRPQNSKLIPFNIQTKNIYGRHIQSQEYHMEGETLNFDLDIGFIRDTLCES